MARKYSLDVEALKELGERAAEEGRRPDFSEEEMFLLKVINKALLPEYQKTGQRPWIDRPSLAAAVEEKVEKVLHSLIERGVVAVEEEGRSATT